MARGRNSKSDQLARKRLIRDRGYKCEWCGYDGYLELDHIVPVSEGGRSNDENCRLLCEKCHADRHGYNKKNYIDKAREFWAPEYY